MLTGLGILAYYSFVPQETVTYNEPVPEKPQTKYQVGPPSPEEMLELVNKERKYVGVAPLKIDKNVQKSAQLKADDFANRNYFSHYVKGTKYTLNDEMAMYVNRSCSSSSENISVGYGNSESNIYGWMSSKPHENAILDPNFTLTGFGVAKYSDHEYYTVQHFCIAK